MTITSAVPVEFDPCPMLLAIDADNNVPTAPFPKVGTLAVVCPLGVRLATNDLRTPG